MLFRKGHQYPVVVEDFDTASAGGLNNLKTKAKELLGPSLPFVHVQTRRMARAIDHLRLAVLLPSGEAPLEDDESVQALRNHDRIVVMFDSDGSVDSGGAAAVDSRKRGRSSIEEEEA